MARHSFKLASKCVQAAGVAAFMLFAGNVMADDDSAKSVELRLEGSCDANNSKLWLVNNHATKPIVATLRWSLAGSKRVVTDKFEVNPAARLEIGCAAKADIVAAQYSVR